MRRQKYLETKQVKMPRLAMSGGSSSYKSTPVIADINDPFSILGRTAVWGA